MMKRRNSYLMEIVFIVIAMLVFCARLMGFIELSAVNTLSSCILDRPLLVPVLDGSSALAGFEDTLLRMIDAFIWAALVMSVGTVMLLALLPHTDLE
ncbi:hypothetical protein ACFQDN_21910 [Pseudomonas asuensis]|uniref:YggT family protein n=1 Tax=Pseudomonas asuensis TaxID=1825787 RepID=A0ABQ2H169_9PSED|nr:hypothetical protein [Pseudomonas asuensis]GGM25455.1 hypothetical protein GCM10009425_40260 [Pseudomonas asuensis]